MLRWLKTYFVCPRDILDRERSYGHFDATFGFGRPTQYLNDMTGEHIEQRRVAYNQGYDAGIEKARLC